jgi:peroxiredoxin
MKYILTFVVYTFLLSVAFPRQIEIKVSNLTIGKAHLSSLMGENVTRIDSLTVNENGKFIIAIPSARSHPGLYRLTFDKYKWIDFVNDGEDISLETDAADLLDSMKVLKSESNKLYYSFVRLNKQYKSKSELLQFFLARYPKDDELYTVTSNRLHQIQKEYLEFVNVTSQKDPGLFIARYIKSAQLPIIDAAEPPEKQLAYLKAHALDHVDFNDVDLMNSDLFSSKAIEYLTYHRNPQLPKELLEKEFMVAVDTLLNRAKVNTDVYKHVVEYLLDGFKKFGFDAIINYIIENYVIKDDICIDQTLEKALQRRMEQVKYFKIGGKVPDIALPDSSGKSLNLKDLKAEKILILFYASWCPHCNALIPQIHQLYKNQKTKSTEVLAISIDTSKTDWLNFVRAKQLEWFNVSDLKGWNGKAVLDYYLYATPTMFLIDDDRNIMAKPLTIDELAKWF